MDIEIKDIIEIAKVALPVLTTIVTYLYTKRASARHSAKQSILQMVMEDQFNWELFKKFPVNYGNIANEYEIYHNNGGNGEVTKRVEEYQAWYRRNEEEMIRMQDYKCRTTIAMACDTRPNKPNKKRRNKAKPINN